MCYNKEKKIKERLCMEKNKNAQTIETPNNGYNGSEIVILEPQDLEQANFVFSTLREYIKQHLKPGIDFGTIPYCGDKEVLFKPGAEKLCRLFKFCPTFKLIDKIVDYETPLFHYHYQCSLYRFDRLVSQCDGLANSKESKFSRKVTVCPKCGKEGTLFNDRDTGNYYCWVKKGGCGAKNIPPSSVNQTNSFDFSTINTLIKMAMKRALVGAVLIASGASEYFTQDLEDN
jgi:ribosomal protein S27AE